MNHQYTSDWPPGVSDSHPLNPLDNNYSYYCRVAPRILSTRLLHLGVLRLHLRPLRWSNAVFFINETSSFRCRTVFFKVSVHSFDSPKPTDRTKKNVCWEILNAESSKTPGLDVVGLSLTRKPTMVRTRRLVGKIIS